MKLLLKNLCILLVCNGGLFISAQKEPEIDFFFQAAGNDKRLAGIALDQISKGWNDSYSGLILDLARFMKPSGTNHPSAKIRKRLIRFLQRRTGKRFGDNLQRWRQWLWSLPDSNHSEIFYFKAKLYSAIDTRMSLFFKPGNSTVIRLDEVDWGGVKVNGIPPLANPKVIPVEKASYLHNRDEVFGISINGKNRAYPKRIIAWHEMVMDRLEGNDITLVYCTLCGAAIPYNSVCGNKKLRFGTSGLLYRSNKLMFDHETHSLWSALTGEPVMGPLVGKGLKLEVFPIVSTSWGEWKEKHPDTTVLSLETGFIRDYREGAAYKEYFSTHKLMFPVSKQDKRLKNKAKVLVLALPARKGKKTHLAISKRFLDKKRLFQLEAGGMGLTVITGRAGANRVYDTGDHDFKKKLNEKSLVDNLGRMWEINESYLQLEGSMKYRLARLPAHLAFWFGWYAQFPDTILVK